MKLTREEHEASWDEGWLFAEGGIGIAGRGYIQKLDSPRDWRSLNYDKPKFASDAEALEFIKNNPSSLHEKVLVLLVTAKFES